MNDPHAEMANLTATMMRAAELVRLMRRRDRAVVDGLDAGHLELLDALEPGPQRITQLAVGVGQDLSTISRRVSRLAAMGLLAKRPDAVDRRVQVVELADQGRSALDAVRHQRQQLLQQVLIGWDAEELATLEAMLSRIVGRLDDIG